MADNRNEDTKEFPATSGTRQKFASGGIIGKLRGEPESFTLGGLNDDGGGDSVTVPVSKLVDESSDKSVAVDPWYRLDLWQWAQVQRPMLTFMILGALIAAEWTGRSTMTTTLLPFAGLVMSFWFRDVPQVKR